MAAPRSERRERAQLTEQMRAQGRTWVDIAQDFQLRYGVNARAAFRLARGWSQSDVAREWCSRWPDDPKKGANISTWERWPVGGHEPSLTTLSRLAEIYECDVAHLVSDYGRHQRLDSAARSPVRLPAAPRRQPAGAVLERAQQDHLSREADLVAPLDLAGLATASDIGAGTIDVVHEAVDLLCRGYAVTPADELRDRSRQRLAWIVNLLGKRVSLQQHTELLVAGSWLAALLGCVHYDLAEREEAEAARQAAQRFATEAGHGEVLGWSHEMSAWFSLVEGRFEQAVAASEAGLEVAGAGSAGVQLALQAAKAYARMGNHTAATATLARGAAVLGQLPRPAHSEHHFVFDHQKWSLYAAGINVLIEQDEEAELHAREVLTAHLRPDGSSNSPMRVADARLDLAIIYTRRGDLDAALDEGLRALDPTRRSLADLLTRGRDLAAAFDQRYPAEARTTEFRERLRDVSRVLRSDAVRAVSHPGNGSSQPAP